jgi:hypothetical protein
VAWNEASKNDEEVDFSVCRMIHVKDLPPIKTKPRYMITNLHKRRRCNGMN